ncbi:hypothetical protein ACFLZV_00090 [Candidatus Margulisiibacteriota bacterium]
MNSPITLIGRQTEKFRVLNETVTTKVFPKISDNKNNITEVFEEVMSHYNTQLNWVTKQGTQKKDAGRKLWQEFIKNISVFIEKGKENPIFMAKLRKDMLPFLIKTAKTVISTGSIGLKDIYTWLLKGINQSTKNVFILLIEEAFILDLSSADRITDKLIGNKLDLLKLLQSNKNKLLIETKSGETEFQILLKKNNIVFDKTIYESIYMLLKASKKSQHNRNDTPMDIFAEFIDTANLRGLCDYIIKLSRPGDKLIGPKLMEIKTKLINTFGKDRINKAISDAVTQILNGIVKNKKLPSFRDLDKHWQDLKALKLGQPQIFETLSTTVAKHVEPGTAQEKDYLILCFQSLVRANSLKEGTITDKIMNTLTEKYSPIQIIAFYKNNYASIYKEFKNSLGINEKTAMSELNSHMQKIACDLIKKNTTSVHKNLKTLPTGDKERQFIKSFLKNVPKSVKKKFTAHLDTTSTEFCSLVQKTLNYNKPKKSPEESFQFLVDECLLLQTEIFSSDKNSLMSRILSEEKSQKWEPELYKYLKKIKGLITKAPESKKKLAGEKKYLNALLDFLKILISYKNHSVVIDLVIEPNEFGRNMLKLFDDKTLKRNRTTVKLFRKKFLQKSKKINIDTHLKDIIPPHKKDILNEIDKLKKKDKFKDAIQIIDGHKSTVISWYKLIYGEPENDPASVKRMLEKNDVLGIDIKSLVDSYTKLMSAYKYFKKSSNVFTPLKKIYLILRDLNKTTNEIMMFVLKYKKKTTSNLKDATPLKKSLLDLVQFLKKKNTQILEEGEGLQIDIIIFNSLSSLLKTREITSEMYNSMSQKIFTNGKISPEIKAKLENLILTRSSAISFSQLIEQKGRPTLKEHKKHAKTIDANNPLRMLKLVDPKGNFLINDKYNFEDPLQVKQLLEKEGYISGEGKINFDKVWPGHHVWPVVELFIAPLEFNCFAFATKNSTRQEAPGKINEKLIQFLEGTMQNPKIKSFGTPTKEKIDAIIKNLSVEEDAIKKIHLVIIKFLEELGITFNQNMNKWISDAYDYSEVNNPKLKKDGLKEFNLKLVKLALTHTRYDNNIFERQCTDSQVIGLSNSMGTQEKKIPKTDSTVSLTPANPFFTIDGVRYNKNDDEVSIIGTDIVLKFTQEEIDLLIGNIIPNINDFFDVSGKVSQKQLRRVFRVDKYETGLDSDVSKVFGNKKFIPDIKNREPDPSSKNTLSTIIKYLEELLFNEALLIEKTLDFTNNIGFIELGKEKGLHGLEVNFLLTALVKALMSGKIKDSDLTKKIHSLMINCKALTEKRLHDSRMLSNIKKLCTDTLGPIITRVKLLEDKSTASAKDKEEIKRFCFILKNYGGYYEIPDDPCSPKNIKTTILALDTISAKIKVPGRELTSKLQNIENTALKQIEPLSKSLILFTDLCNQLDFLSKGQTELVKPPKVSLLKKKDPEQHKKNVEILSSYYNNVVTKPPGNYGDKINNLTFPTDIGALYDDAIRPSSDEVSTYSKTWGTTTKEKRFPYVVLTVLNIIKDHCVRFNEGTTMREMESVEQITKWIIPLCERFSLIEKEDKWNDMITKLFNMITLHLPNQFNSVRLKKALKIKLDFNTVKGKVHSSDYNSYCSIKIEKKISTYLKSMEKVVRQKLEEMNLLLNEWNTKKIKLAILIGLSPEKRELRARIKTIIIKLNEIQPHYIMLCKRYLDSQSVKGLSPKSLKKIRYRSNEIFEKSLKFFNDYSNLTSNLETYVPSVITKPLDLKLDFTELAVRAKSVNERMSKIDLDIKAFISRHKSGGTNIAVNAFKEINERIGRFFLELRKELHRVKFIKKEGGYQWPNLRERKIAYIHAAITHLRDAFVLLATTKFRFPNEDTESSYAKTKKYINNTSKLFLDLSQKFKDTAKTDLQKNEYFIYQITFLVESFCNSLQGIGQNIKKNNHIKAVFTTHYKNYPESSYYTPEGILKFLGKVSDYLITLNDTNKPIFITAINDFLKDFAEQYELVTGEKIVITDLSTNTSDTNYLTTISGQLTSNITTIKPKIQSILEAGQFRNRESKVPDYLNGNLSKFEAFRNKLMANPGAVIIRPIKSDLPYSIHIDHKREAPSFLKTILKHNKRDFKLWGNEINFEALLKLQKSSNKVFATSLTNKTLRGSGLMLGDQNVFENDHLQSERVLKSFVNPMSCAPKHPLKIDSKLETLVPNSFYESRAAVIDILEKIKVVAKGTLFAHFHALDDFKPLYASYFKDIFAEDKFIVALLSHLKLSFSSEALNKNKVQTIGLVNSMHMILFPEDTITLKLTEISTSSEIRERRRKCQNKLGGIIQIRARVLTNENIDDFILSFSDRSHDKLRGYLTQLKALFELDSTTDVRSINQLSNLLFSGNKTELVNNCTLVELRIRIEECREEIQKIINDKTSVKNVQTPGDLFDLFDDPELGKELDALDIAIKHVFDDSEGKNNTASIKELRYVCKKLRVAFSMTNESTDKPVFLAAIKSCKEKLQIKYRIKFESLLTNKDKFKGLVKNLLVWKKFFNTGKSLRKTSIERMTKKVTKKINTGQKRVIAKFFKLRIAKNPKVTRSTLGTKRSVMLIDHLAKRGLIADLNKEEDVLNFCRTMYRFRSCHDIYKSGKLPSDEKELLRLVTDINMLANKFISHPPLMLDSDSIKSNFNQRFEDCIKGLKIKLGLSDEEEKATLAYNLLLGPLMKSILSDFSFNEHLKNNINTPMKQQYLLIWDPTMYRLSKDSNLVFNRLKFKFSGANHKLIFRQNVIILLRELGFMPKDDDDFYNAQYNIDNKIEALKKQGLAKRNPSIPVIVQLDMLRYACDILKAEFEMLNEMKKDHSSIMDVSIKHNKMVNQNLQIVKKMEELHTLVTGFHTEFTSTERDFSVFQTAFSAIYKSDVYLKNSKESLNTKLDECKSSFLLFSSKATGMTSVSDTLGLTNNINDLEGFKKKIQEGNKFLKLVELQNIRHKETELKLKAAFEALRKALKEIGKAMGRQTGIAKSNINTVHSKYDGQNLPLIHANLGNYALYSGNFETNFEELNKLILTVSKLNATLGPEDQIKGKNLDALKLVQQHYLVTQTNTLKAENVNKILVSDDTSAKKISKMVRLYAKLMVLKKYINIDTNKKAWTVLEKELDNTMKKINLYSKEFYQDDKLEKSGIKSQGVILTDAKAKIETSGIKYDDKKHQSIDFRNALKKISELIILLNGNPGILDANKIKLEDISGGTTATLASVLTDNQLIKPELFILKRPVEPKEKLFPHIKLYEAFKIFQEYARTYNKMLNEVSKRKEKLTRELSKGIPETIEDKHITDLPSLKKLIKLYREYQDFKLHYKAVTGVDYPNLGKLYANANKISVKILARLTVLFSNKFRDAIPTSGNVANDKLSPDKCNKMLQVIEMYLIVLPTKIINAGVIQSMKNLVTKFLDVYYYKNPGTLPPGFLSSPIFKSMLAEYLKENKTKRKDILEVIRSKTDTGERKTHNVIGVANVTKIQLYAFELILLLEMNKTKNMYSSAFKSRNIYSEFKITQANKQLEYVKSLLKQLEVLIGDVNKTTAGGFNTRSLKLTELKNRFTGIINIFETQIKLSEVLYKEENDPSGHNFRSEIIKLLTNTNIVVNTYAKESPGLDMTLVDAKAQLGGNANGTKLQTFVSKFKIQGTYASEVGEKKTYTISYGRFDDVVFNTPDTFNESTLKILGNHLKTLVDEFIENNKGNEDKIVIFFNFLRSLSKLYEKKKNLDDKASFIFNIESLTKSVVDDFSQLPPELQKKFLSPEGIAGYIGMPEFVHALAYEPNEFSKLDPWARRTILTFMRKNSLKNPTETGVDNRKLNFRYWSDFKSLVIKDPSLKTSYEINKDLFNLEEWEHCKFDTTTGTNNTNVIAKLKVLGVKLVIDVSILDDNDASLANFNKIIYACRAKILTIYDGSWLQSCKGHDFVTTGTAGDNADIIKNLKALSKALGIPDLDIGDHNTITTGDKGKFEKRLALCEDKIKRILSINTLFKTGFLEILGLQKLLDDARAAVFATGGIAGDNTHIIKALRVLLKKLGLGEFTFADNSIDGGDKTTFNNMIKDCLLEIQKRKANLLSQTGFPDLPENMSSSDISNMVKFIKEYEINPSSNNVNRKVYKLPLPLRILLHKHNLLNVKFKLHPNTTVMGDQRAKMAVLFTDPGSERIPSSIINLANKVMELNQKSIKSKSGIFDSDIKRHQREQRVVFHMMPILKLFINEEKLVKRNRLEQICVPYFDALKKYTDSSTDTLSTTDFTKFVKFKDFIVSLKDLMISEADAECITYLVKQFIDGSAPLNKPVHELGDITKMKIMALPLETRKKLASAELIQDAQVGFNTVSATVTDPKEIGIMSNEIYALQNVILINTVNSNKSNLTSQEYKIHKNAERTITQQFNNSQIVFDFLLNVMKLSTVAGAGIDATAKNAKVDTFKNYLKSYLEMIKGTSSSYEYYEKREKKPELSLPPLNVLKNLTTLFKGELAFLTATTLIKDYKYTVEQINALHSLPMPIRYNLATLGLTFDPEAILLTETLKNKIPDTNSATSVDIRTNHDLVLTKFNNALKTKIEATVPVQIQNQFQLNQSLFDFLKEIYPGVFAGNPASDPIVLNIQKFLQAVLGLFNTTTPTTKHLEDLAIYIRHYLTKNVKGRIKSDWKFGDQAKMLGKYNALPNSIKGLLKTHGMLDEQLSVSDKIATMGDGDDKNELEFLFNWLKLDGTNFGITGVEETHKQKILYNKNLLYKILLKAVAGTNYLEYLELIALVDPGCWAKFCEKITTAKPTISMRDDNTSTFTKIAFKYPAIQQKQLTIYMQHFNNKKDKKDWKSGDQPKMVIAYTAITSAEIKGKIKGLNKVDLQLQVSNAFNATGGDATDKSELKFLHNFVEKNDFGLPNTNESDKLAIQNNRDILFEILLKAMAGQDYFELVKKLDPRVWDVFCQHVTAKSDNANLRSNTNTKFSNLAVKYPRERITEYHKLRNYVMTSTFLCGQFEQQLNTHRKHLMIIINKICKDKAANIASDVKNTAEYVWRFLRSKILNSTKTESKVKTKVLVEDEDVFEEKTQTKKTRENFLRDNSPFVELIAKKYTDDKKLLVE